MLPVHFPDLHHPERTVDIDQYVDTLLDPPPKTNSIISTHSQHTGEEDEGEIPCRCHCSHLTRPYVYAIVQIVRNWVLDVISQADQKKMDPVLSLKNAVGEYMIPPTVSHAVRQLRLELVRRNQDAPLKNFIRASTCSFPVN